MTFHHWIRVVGFSILCAAAANAAEFRAEINQTDIAQDESVSLKLIIQADGTVPVETPEFNAPGFEELQNYQSNSVESYYDSESGKVGAKFSRSFTYVMRPKSTGKLKIDGIKVRVDGQVFTSEPITVNVSGGGGGSSPPRGYGGGGSGLRGAAKKPRGTTLFLRTEVDKTKVFRGQQVVVNYYLYSRATNFNASADRYPDLNGFLKEELDIPVLTGRLHAENVVLDGTAYRRVLLASFAAYPLKEGKLKIDPMEVKATYIDDRESGGRNEDPFGDDDLFRNFFRSAQPKMESLRSEVVEIEVLPLPAVPKDMNYTGAIGDYEVISAADRTELKAHEALTLTLKVEGSGNLSNIETPKVLLPDGFELYEAKSQTKGKAGVGEKVFEYLLIARKEGDYVLPPITLGFFDPKKGQYVSKATQPISVHVQAGEPGAENQAPVQMNPNKEIASPVQESKKIFDLMGRGSESVKAVFDLKIQGKQKLGLVLILALMGLVALFFAFRTKILRSVAGIGSAARKRNQKEREWAKFKRQAEEAQRLPFQEIVSIFGFLECAVEDALFQKFGVMAKGMTRPELKESLVDTGRLSEDLWRRLVSLLEFTETLRFASQAGAVSEDRTRNELKMWIAECEQILLALK